MKADKFIALEIDEEMIRMGIFALDDSGELELLDQGYATIEPDKSVTMAHEARVATALKRLLADKNPQTRQTILTIGGKSIFSRVVKLPPVAPDKIAVTIRHEAVQNIPFPIDDVVWDSHIENPSVSEPDVMLVAVKSDLVGGLVHAVVANGLSVIRVDVAPVALANAVRHIHPGPSESRLLIDIGSASSQAVFIDGDRTYFRTLAVKAEDKEGLAREIGRSIAFYQGQSAGRSLSQIFLTGQGAESYAKGDHFGMPSVELDLRPVVKDIGVDSNDFAVLVGSAVTSYSDVAILIDLIPQSAKAERSLSQKRPWWLACAVLVILILAVWIAGLSQMSAMAGKELGAVSERVQTLSKVESQLVPLESSIAKLEMRTAVYQNVVEQRTLWLEALREIQRCLPSGMFLISSNPLNEQGMVRGLRVEVVSYLDKEPAGEDVVKLLRDSLRESSLFSAETKVFSRPSKRQFVRQFVLDIYFEEVLSDEFLKK